MVATSSCRQDERRLFRGSPSSPAAARSRRPRQVCGADLDTLQSLVEKSLLRFSGERYWMLETIRRVCGVTARAVRRARFRARAVISTSFSRSQRNSTRRTEPTRTLLERFALERDNFRAALTWASSSGRLDAQLDLVGRTSAFWANRGHLAEGQAWVESAVLASDGGTDGPTREEFFWRAHDSRPDSVTSTAERIRGGEPRDRQRCGRDARSRVGAQRGRHRRDRAWRLRPSRAVPRRRRSHSHKNGRPILGRDGDQHDG